jgi:predicted alpha/beta superfamily hydrolase
MDYRKHNGTATDSFEVVWEGRRHAIFVSLPARYERGSHAYPVLYVLDGNLMFGAAADMARLVSAARLMVPEGAPLPMPAPPETIVVGIGYPVEDPQSILQSAGVERMYDFTYLADNLGPEGDRLKQPLLQYYPQGVPYGGGASFLRMITTELKAQLSTRYRVDPTQSILFGASAGGTLAAYALFEATSHFTHYIIASPSLYLCGEDLFEREAAYAARNNTLPANVFLSFGARELDLFAVASIASSTTRLAERLIQRRYPDLKVHSAVLHDETHARACLAALPRGLDVLFGVT